MEVRAQVLWCVVGEPGRVARRTSAWWEHAVAAAEHRPSQRLVHAVLEVDADGTTHVEMVPTWGRPAPRTTVVATGAVASQALGWCPLLRYEVRRVDGAAPRPSVLHVDTVAVPADVLDALAEVPTLVWGRDQSRTGDMWTSNSVVSWLLARAGTTGLAPPPGCRAPGWHAGVAVAAR